MDYLFRGKTKEGEWVEGDLQHSIGGIHITFLENLPPTYADPSGDIRRLYFEVLPETVGMWTGLTDKKGKKIFEGDIVEAWSDGYKHTGAIKWRLEGQPAIIIYPAFANQGFWKLHGNSKRCDDGVTVISNIHDNPELIKEGE
jgi:hypothetical protein